MFGSTATRSPTLTLVTSEPMAATTPEFSWPRMIGGTAGAEPGRPAYRSWSVPLNLRSVQFLDLELLDASQNQSLHDCSFLTERFCFCFPQTPCVISHTIRFSKKFCKSLFVKFFTKRVAFISKASASSRRRQETTIAHKNQKEITSKTQRRATTLARTIDVFRRLQWRHEESTPAPIRNPPRTLLHR